MVREPVRGTAQVRVNGRPVGVLEFGGGGCRFRYTDDLTDPRHAVLGQVFEERPRASYQSPVGLPHWFTNLLPEPGSGLRRYYMAQWGDRHLDDARLLLALGEDLPGAVTVHPIDVPQSGILVMPPTAEIEAERMHLSALAGAQPKMSLIRDGERLTLPARGESGDVIAKLPERAFDKLCENEYLMMRWATVSGLEVPRVELVAPGSVPPIFDTIVTPSSPIYMVERFDRGERGTKIHIEDFAQVLNVAPALRDATQLPGGREVSYDRIAIVINELTGPSGVIDYVRRLVAMTLMGNTDAHLKNWSLIYRDGHTPKLSPAYDLVCSTIYKQLSYSALTFALGGETMPNLVDVSCFYRLAEAVGVDPHIVVDAASAMAQTMVEAWPDVRLADGELFPALVKHIDDRLARHPLLR